MKRALLFLFFGLALSTGCVQQTRFDRAIRTAAAQDAPCGGEIAVRSLTSYGYRVQACEETTYYRCYFARRTMGQTQCCYRVKDEDAATSIFGVSPAQGPVTCLDASPAQ